MIELLKLAAKAAGMCISSHIGLRYDYIVDDNTGKEWNPLTDDGDAFRLASKVLGSYELRTWKVLPANMYKVSITVCDGPEVEAIHEDRLAATRAAIVNAAVKYWKMCDES